MCLLFTTLYYNLNIFYPVGLKECNADPTEKTKMIDMLKRVEEEADLDGLDNGDDLHERLSDLDLERDIDKVWERLSAEVLKPFN